MIRTTIEIQADVVKDLDKLADAQGRSRQELIRDVLTAFTQDAKRPVPRGIGAYRSGRTDVADRAEHLLKEAAKEGRWRS